MYCRYCGSELPENAKFCSSCGARLTEEEVQTYKPQEPQVVFVKEISEEEKERGPWKKFARTGLTLGILSTAIPFYGILIMPLGFIFSGMGLASNVNKGKAITGLILSAVSIINFILLIALLIYLNNY